ncbi:MAG: asparagine synthase (glutamine-hydrolyzing) [Lachnospiraceae bacterium]|nr:asparagine synthase (glutamine-hydrolyzing) [Lachnospiraceae bacterium]
MCGINGILGKKKNIEDNISRMNSVIIHRGPDAQGIWMNEDKSVAFGHRRLSIIELSEKGAQPMTSISGEYTIVFNGEIYNYLEIKEYLTKDGGNIEFRGNSDTELLLNAIEFYGIEKTLGLIKGMFAFAVYEKASGCIYLARDRMGEKPLYYGRVAGNTVFASDIGSIEKIEGFDNSVDGRVLGSYFKGGYIPAPYTIYKDVYKLRPGHYLVIKPSYSDWKEVCYWDIKAVALYGCEHTFNGSFNEASEELEKLIRNSIKGQMISDVPLGAFLSGGIDSSLTVALMQSMSDKPVRTFTIGFEDEKYNEAVFASETASHLGTEHTQMYVTKDDILNVVKDIPKAFSEPFADSSQIPTMLVSRMTKQHVTVSLSGDAGDEFFCGYNSYKDVRKGLETLNNKLAFVKGRPRKALGRMAYLIGGNSNRTIHKIATSLSVATPEEWYRNVRDDDILLNRLSIIPDQIRDNTDDYTDGFLNDPEHNLMLMDMLQYLPDDILVKVDRSGMFYSLESRIPLLDRDVMEFAWTLPLEYKYDGVTTKKILKDILFRYVPKEMMDRPKKGFSVPLGRWLRGEELGVWAEGLLADSRAYMGEYVDIKTIDLMWQNCKKTGYGERNIWNILMLAQWFLERSIHG